MKRMLRCLTMMVSITAGMANAADVGVSISIGDPGFFGRLDINNYPRPQLLYPQPVVIERTRTVYEPLYLHVPPGHARDWRKHCGKYGACNRPVYFVQDRWYNDVYAPRYRERHRGPGHDKGHDKGYGKGHDKGYDKGHGKGRDRD